ncbi:MAG: hypothetical protein HY973_01640 [Candidatus Kerfeldbacteria bacterium]|nr:hypothetical protein [Candidatus Kerfeldbacteria bacterium]
MAKSNGQNWTLLATYPNGGSEPHQILANVNNLSTQGTVRAKMKDTLQLVEKKETKITVFDKSLFLKICANEGINREDFKSVINFKK